MHFIPLTFKLRLVFPEYEAERKEVSRNFLLACGKRETKGRTFAQPGLRPDPAAVHLDDLLTDREPNARAGIGRTGVKTLKNGKDTAKVLRIYAQSVVTDAKDPFRSGTFG